MAFIRHDIKISIKPKRNGFIIYKPHDYCQKCSGTINCGEFTEHDIEIITKLTKNKFMISEGINSECQRY